jgi:dienelactone hydrolase
VTTHLSRRTLLLHAAGVCLLAACAETTRRTPQSGASWPAGVPVRVHGMDADPYSANEGDIDAARALVNEADDGELFVYPGDRHRFTDSSLPTYDANAAAPVTQRVLDFITSR